MKQLKLILLAIIITTYQTVVLADQLTTNEKQLAQLPVQWARALDSLDTKATTLRSIFSSTLTNSSSVRVNNINFQALNHWYLQRAKALTSSDHRMVNFRQIMKANGKALLSFEYIIKEQRANAPLTISRLKVEWLVVFNAKGEPLVTEIHESYLSPFMNSGAHIQC